MKPSEKCKAAGLKSLKELSIMTGVSIHTLVNWNTGRPELFDLVILGASVAKEQAAGVESQPLEDVEQ